MAIKPSSKITAAALLSALSLFSLPVTAYIGPGTGLSAIGSLVALIAAILVAVFGFMWYPLKRMLRSRQAAQQADGDLEADSQLEAKTQDPEQEVPHP